MNVTYPPDRQIRYSVSRKRSTVAKVLSFPARPPAPPPVDVQVTREPVLTIEVKPT